MRVIKIKLLLLTNCERGYAFMSGEKAQSYSEVFSTKLMDIGSKGGKK